MRKLLMTLVAVVTVAVSSLFAMSPVHAAQEHCLVITDGVDSANNLIVKSYKCYGSYGDVLKAAGATKSTSSARLGDSPQSFGINSIIGTHYDGTNGTGTSFSVVGSDCNGGGLPVPLGWNDRISSTLNGCPAIYHYENTNYTGGLEITTGVGNLTNLGGLNNKTSSLTYRT